jgi:hypothetical protein
MLRGSFLELKFVMSSKKKFYRFPYQHQDAFADKPGEGNDD